LATSEVFPTIVSVKLRTRTGACAVIAAAVLEVGRLDASPKENTLGSAKHVRIDHHIQTYYPRTLLMLKSSRINIYPAYTVGKRRRLDIVRGPLWRRNMEEHVFFDNISSVCFLKGGFAVRRVDRNEIVPKLARDVSLHSQGV
jgi:hypothetical protein